MTIGSIIDAWKKPKRRVELKDIVFNSHDVKKIIKTLGEKTVLDNMDFDVIEGYIRKNKLNKIKNNMK